MSPGGRTSRNLLRRKPRPAEPRVLKKGAIAVPLAFDLRVVPAVAVGWGSVVMLLFLHNPVVSSAVAGTMAGAAAILLHQRIRGELALPAIVGSVVAAAVGIRQAVARMNPISEKTGQSATVDMVLTRAPRSTTHGALAEAKINGLPGRVTVFGDQSLLDHDQGTSLTAIVGVGESSRPNLSGITVNLRVVLESSVPNDHVARVRDGLTTIASSLPSGPDRMIPAMVLGDERGFTDLDETMMVDSGLAHLSAVSGANVALILGVTMWALTWAGPTIRVVGGALALAGFVAVVGTEPSVLRAMMTGIVGLIAIVASRRRNAVPALACGIVILLVISPELALAPGFMLSVAATFGLIVVVAPVTTRLLTIPTVDRWPAVLVRAIAVTLVAHIATVPVLALLIGRVSHISILANLIAAPAVAPVTILGTAAAVFVFLGLTPIAIVFVWLAAPFAWWVHSVGSLFAQVPGAASGMGLLGVICALGLAVFFFRFPTFTSTTLLLTTLGVAIALVRGLHLSTAPPGGIAAVCVVGEKIEVFPGEGPGGARPDRRCRKAIGGLQTIDPSVLLRTDVAADLDKAHDLDHTSSSPTWIAVDNCGDRARRWIITPSGIPVVCPFRDGPQVLYPDGTVWGSSGTMEP